MTKPQQQSPSIAGKGRPFDLFGLTGERSDVIRHAWYGDAADRLTVRPLTKFDFLMLVVFMVTFTLVVCVLGTEDGLFKLLNFHPAWEKQAQDWLGVLWIVSGAGLLLSFLHAWLLPRPGEREEMAERRSKLQAARQKNCLTFEVYTPGANGRIPRRAQNEQPLLMRRNRHSSPVQLASLRPASKFLVTLEALTPQELERLYADYVSMD